MSVEVVDILLATYNGARFLREQLDSIVGQTYAHWRLLVRDDGSSDGTAAILEEYQRRIGERMQIVRDELGRLGPALNFGRLLRLSDAAYATFCDQDDVWMPDRIEQLLAEMRRMERETGAARPILVHSDLQVIDEEGHEISRSFWNYQYLRPEVAYVCPTMESSCSRRKRAPLYVASKMSTTSTLTAVLSSQKDVAGRCRRRAEGEKPRESGSGARQSGSSS